MNRIIPFAFFSWLLLPGTLPAQNNPSDPADRILAAVEQVRSENDLMGTLLTVRQGGELILERALGESVTEQAATLDMHFRGGGVTINGLVSILLQGVDAGDFTLEDTIEPWFPDFPNGGAITLRMLANCTAGIDDYVFTNAFDEAFYGNVFRGFSAQELIDFALPATPVYEPGTNWHYSHTTFVMLGQIMEQVYQKPFGDLIRERVYEPLALQSTHYLTNPEMPEPVLHAFTNERGVFEDSTYWNPSWTSHSSSVVTTIGDVDRMARGIFSTELISPESLEEMLAPDTVGLGPNTAERYYALGIGVINGWVVQNPNFGGYQGVMAYNLEHDISIAVFTTRTQTSADDVHFGMALYDAIVEALEPPAPEVLIENAGSGLRLEWESRDGFNYQVETSPGLDSFSSEGNPSYHGSGLPIQHFHPWPNGAPETTFFRIEVREDQ